MKPIQDLLGAERDRDGVMHVNRNATGCPYCGSVDLKQYVVDGETRAVFYHAGAECCSRRLTDQIGWRATELQALQKDLDAKYEHLDELRQKAEHAYGNEKAKAEQAVKRAERAMRTIERGFTERRESITGERERLQKRRAWMTRQEQREGAA